MNHEQRFIVRPRPSVGDKEWDNECARRVAQKVDEGLYRQARWIAGAIRSEQRRTRALAKIDAAEAEAGYPLQPPAASIVED